MKNIDPHIMQEFIIWLEYHEDDIAIGMNDFDDLRGIFKEVFGREAKPSDI